jgi:hypothetical protein
LDWIEVLLLKHLLRTIRFPHRPALVTGPLSLISAPEGFKFWNKKTELTTRVGLSVSWFQNGERKDCSSFQCNTVLWKKNRLQIEKIQNSVSILFDFDICNPLCFEITITPNIPMEKLKITLFLQTQYKNWVADLHEDSFPRHGAWISVGLPDSQCKTIGAHSYFEKFFPILFSFENAIHTIENSDAQTAARVLCAEYPQQTLYRGRISFFENTKLFWNHLRAAHFLKRP